MLFKLIWFTVCIKNALDPDVRKHDIPVLHDACLVLIICSQGNLSA